MRAEIIATGTELLLGQIVNTNARFLAEKLAEKGIDVYWQTVVGDNPLRLEEAFRLALSRADLVLSSGGLGPTADDITKETLAKVMGLPLEPHAGWQEYLEQLFSRRPGFRMPPSNRKQALLPRGARLIANENGTAPGIWVEKEGKIVVLMPGPPRELEPMFTKHVMPLLPETGSIIMSRVLKITGLGESLMEELVSDLVRAQTNPTIAPLARQNESHLRISAKAKSREECLRLLAATEEKLLARLGEHVFARDEETMEEVVAGLLMAKKYTLAVAESCTGGLLAHTLTNVPGSSAFFLSGLVTYSNAAKERLLHVPSSLLAEKGAVSAEVAQAMAGNARELAHSTLGVGITGIAGPDGGSPEKPVGLVYIALATPEDVRVKRFNFFGKRENIKERAVLAALNMIRLYLIRQTG
ncbi:MAG TPA: competence/damage-inducible protein A [Firmicutes bacterium]|nr:competence/damage-inducible protein A [Bacillota bacterium]